VESQLFLPLGPRLTRCSFDGAAYAVHTDSDNIVTIDDGAQIRLIDDLQWKSAHAALSVPSDMPETQLRSSAARCETHRPTERTVYREEIFSESAPTCGRGMDRARLLRRYRSVWPAAGFVDTGLGYMCLLLEVH
jgi:hypothetical protein